MRKFTTAALALVAAFAVQPGVARADELADAMEKVRQINRVKGTGGWQDYADLRLNMTSVPEGPEGAFRFQSTHDEILMTSDLPDRPRITQFVIPFSVYMARGLSEEEANAPDALEWIGLQSQFVLFFLGQAFPDGPKSVQGAETRKVRDDGKSHEIRFLGGLVNLKPPWRAEATAKRTAKGPVDFRLVFGTADGPKAETTVTGTWDGGSTDFVLANAEPLEGWTVNYFGAHTRDPQGQPHFEASVGDTSGFTTVGDIRAARHKQAP